jgi:hypothetical protein
MKVIFGGKFENALVRTIDEVLTPNRNASMHQYYMGLNRRVPKSYSDRCGTFIALAEEVLVPQIDWNFPIHTRYHGELEGLNLGIRSTDAGGREWDEDTRAFVKFLMRSDVLSAQSKAHISILQTSHYPFDDRQKIEQNPERIGEAVGDHYLNRLFLQLRSAREEGAFLVLAEEDIAILQEVGEFAVAKKLPTPFDLPEVSRVIEPEAFCNGILNFSSPDIRSVAAVRSDEAIRGYAAKVSAMLKCRTVQESQERALAAMREAYEKTEIGRRVENVFEVGSWLVKPLHYVPIIGEVVGAAEDMKDAFLAWEKRERQKNEWYLLGAKMTDIAIRDYFRRKDNL